MSNFKSFEKFKEEQEELNTDYETESDEEWDSEDDSDISDAEIEEEDEIEDEPEEKHEHFHLGFKRWIIGITVFLLIVILALLFLPVPFGHIEIKGTKSVTVDDIILEGQLRRPVNVLQISTEDLAERLSKDMRIESVNVTRRFPFAVIVNVADRKPVAVMQSEFGYVLVDKNGVVIKLENAVRKANLPMITGVKLGNILLGDEVKEEGVKKGLEFLNSLSPEGVKAFSEFNAGDPENLMAYTRDGISVHLGDGSAIEERAALAENMVNDVRARDLAVEYLDTTIGSAYIKLKK